MMRKAISMLIGATLISMLAVAMHDDRFVGAQDSLEVPVPDDASRLDRLIDAVETMTGRIDRVLADIETRITSLDERLAAIESSQVALAARVDGIAGDDLASDPNWPPENPPDPQPLPAVDPVPSPVVLVQTCGPDGCQLEWVSVAGDASACSTCGEACDCDSCDCDLLAPRVGQPVRNVLRATGRVISDIRMARLERLDGNVGPIRQGMIERRAARIAGRRGF